MAQTTQATSVPQSAHSQQHDVLQEARVEITADSLLPPFMHQWLSKKLITLTVTAKRTLRKRVELLVLLDGSPVAVSYPGIGIKTFAAGISTKLTLDEIYPTTDNIRIVQKKMAGGRKGEIVGGKYTICASLCDSISDFRYSNVACIERNILEYKRAVPLLPIDGSSISSDSTIIFQWFPVQPAPPSSAVLTLSVFPLNIDQSTSDAVRMNQALIVQKLPSTAHRFTWNAPPKSQAYVWQVYVEDTDGTRYGGSDGYGAPSSFAILHKQRNEVTTTNKKKNTKKR